MRFVTNETIKKMSIDDFNNSISENPHSQKSIILEYMRKFDPCAFTSAPVYDKLTGEMVFDANNAHSDGTFTWYESEIYHFEKYNLKLNDDFIQHILDNF